MEQGDFRPRRMPVSASKTGGEIKMEEYLNPNHLEEGKY